MFQGQPARSVSRWLGNWARANDLLPRAQTEQLGASKREIVTRAAHNVRFATARKVTIASGGCHELLVSRLGLGVLLAYAPHCFSQERAILPDVTRISDGKTWK